MVNVPSPKETPRVSGFTQLYDNYMPEIRWLIGKSGKAANIFFFIMEEMDTGNALVCSYEAIQQKFNFSRMTVYRSIKLLEDNGFISIMKSGTSNVYMINPLIAWKSWSNKRQYAKFSGSIIVSHKENSDFDGSKQKERFSKFKAREGV